MPKKETDRALIRKYLNGELDTRAMHRLERRAQHDPFLMDALEGYERAGSDQQANLDELAARLQQRVARKERRIIPLPFIAAAASVLVVLTIGGLWLYKGKHEKREVAQLVKPEAKTAPGATVKPVTPGGIRQATLAPASYKKHPKKSPIISKPNNLPIASTVTDEKIASAENKINANDTTIRRSLNEVTVTGYAAQKKKDIASSVATITPDSINKPTTASAGQLLQGRAAGLAVLSSKKASRKSKSPPTMIKGKVVGKDDGQPIVGAQVSVAGTNIGTVTDTEGRFNLYADSNKTKLNIAYIGYQSRQVNIGNRDSLKNIALQPTNSTLNEVVVVGYGSKKANADEIPVIDAHPTVGWRSFNKYLKEGAISPDGKAGVVKLSMSVAADGTINDIKVEKGISAATDQKAIDLINDGPTLVGSTSRKFEKVRVRVKFIKK